MITFVFAIVTVVMTVNINKVLALQTGKETCLTNLNINNTSPTSLSLEWKYLQNEHCSMQNVKEFKIYYRHEGYIACGGEGGVGQKVISIKQTETINVLGLEPFSFYSIEVKALLKAPSRKVRGKTVRKRPETLKIDDIQTGKALPEVKLRLPKDLIYKTESSLTFTWSQPSLSDCQAFHSNLGGYFYLLKEEGHSQTSVGNISIDQNPSVKFSNLQPATNYKLFVYITDQDGGYDPNNVLVLEASTEPSSPPPPTKLKVISKGGEYVVSWNPPKHSRGRIEKYLLQLKLEPQSKWIISEYRRPPWNKGLNGEINHNLNTHINNNANYTFRVQAFNEEVSQPSPWSDSITISTLSFISSSSNTTISIILILFIVTFISIFLVVFIWKKRHRLSSFRLVPTHETFVRSNPTASPSPKGGKQSRDKDYEAPILRTKQNNYVTEPHQANNKNIYVDMEKPIQGSQDQSSEKPVKRRSCLDPLPAVPGENDSVYYNIRDLTVTDDPDPGVNQLPRDKERTYELGSVESLDSEGYLKPNFKQ